MELQQQGLGASRSRERELELFDDEESDGEVAAQQNKFSLLMELEDDD